MFFDQALSASGKMACASCHDPDQADAPANGSGCSAGGKTLSDVGTRAVPSRATKDFYAALRRYCSTTRRDQHSRPWRRIYARRGVHARTLADQAESPLLASHEMANESAAIVAKKFKNCNMRGCSKPALVETFSRTFH